jgi:hypothetical protein
MKILVLSLIGAATLLITAGCEGDDHGHHDRQVGGVYDGDYRSYGHEQWPGYPARQGYWDRSDDWHPH